MEVDESSIMAKYKKPVSSTHRTPVMSMLVYPSRTRVKLRGFPLLAKMLVDLSYELTSSFFFTGYARRVHLICVTAKGYGLGRHNSGGGID